MSTELEWAVLGAVDFAAPCSMVDAYRRGILLWPYKQAGADAIGEAFLTLEREGYIERDDQGDPDLTETWRPSAEGKRVWQENIKGMTEFGERCRASRELRDGAPMEKELSRKTSRRGSLPSNSDVAGQGQKGSGGDIGPPSPGADSQGVAAPDRRGGSSPPPVTCFGCDPAKSEDAPKCDDCQSFDLDFPNWDGYTGVDGDDIR